MKNIFNKKKFNSFFLPFLRVFLALLLIPFVISLVSELFGSSVQLLSKASAGTLPFWLGLFGYFIFQILFDKPIRAYVFGHELTHALFGILAGAKIKGFKVSGTGGSVNLTKTGLVIALSPYFFPIYTIILIGIYRVVSLFLDVGAFTPYFIFLAGFSISFHLFLTYYAISRGQSDLKQFGIFFSLVVVLMINCCVLILLMKVVLPDHINLQSYFINSFNGTLNIWESLYSFGGKIWISFQQTK